MRKTIRNTLAALGALALMSGAAAAQSKVTIAIGGAGCLCYLPTMLAQELGEYKKAGVEVELVDFKGGSQALTAVIGGSATWSPAISTIASTLLPRTRRLKPLWSMTAIPA
jgi:NitT/TauT family transport system substrate-binding protein